jgi:hypothetical protein
LFKYKNNYSEPHLFLKIALALNSCINLSGLFLFSPHILLVQQQQAVDEINNKGTKEEIIMSSKNNTSVPEAKEALNRFKYEVASELGVPLKDGYNGDLTSRQNGSVGGYMVKKMIEAQEKQMAGK